MNKPAELLFHLSHELYSMETHFVSYLPVLSGSVMNIRLRRLVTNQAFRARDRRDWFGNLVNRYGVNPHGGYTAIKGILNEGSRELASARNPFTRDLVMLRHCLRIEQHVTSAYCTIASPGEFADFPAEADRLTSLLSKQKIAGMRLQAIESELSQVASFHRLPVDFGEQCWLDN